MRFFVKEIGAENGERGYTLVELLVVIAIVAILATQIVTGFNSPVPKLKSAAFNLRSDFNLARAEAVTRNVDVRVAFIFDTEDLDSDGDLDQGYRIWLDDAPANKAYDAGETEIKKVAFHDFVSFYDVNAAGGPSGTGDGVTFVDGGVNNTFVWQPDGTPNVGGTVYMFVKNPGVADPNDAEYMQVAPFEVVTAGNTGRVRMLRWQSGAWATK